MKKALVFIEEGHGRGKSVFGRSEGASKGQGGPGLSMVLEHVVHLFQFVQA